ncbi:hypothetical protein [Actibacterium sp. 188UL27-1]|uniref:hypothetical protein n=1 Tax=Actibacterium sp. 188UL27-1 TaxID=2786961 RepID=UPI001957E932|nr:hypothetical protein [Actibacterium sp. 188UL27-1]MBM7066473.1 hypothetical protein [Actibacterium sp. 188UL27-1]
MTIRGNANGVALPPETTEAAYDYFLVTAVQVDGDISWNNGNGFSLRIWTISFCRTSTLWISSTSRDRRAAVDEAAMSVGCGL